VIQIHYKTQSDWLAEAARDLLPSTVAIATSDPRRGWSGLHPEEVPATANMAALRRLEYTAGRKAAHGAMDQLSIHDQPVVNGADRAPVWPEGIVGSISHTSDYCVAAAAYSNDIHTVGLDIEPKRALHPELIYQICNREERVWLAEQPVEQQGYLARLIFSAKECAYKCQYPLTKKLFGFKALNIDLDLEEGRFGATFVQPVGLFCMGCKLRGQFYIGHDIIMTTMAVEPVVRAPLDRNHTIG
jgi:4'-phosphopantetheinyl transferase EntD